MKRLLLALAILAAVAALGFAIMRGPDLYRGLLASRLLHAARKEATQGHPNQAIHFYVLALQRTPRNLPAMQEFAGYLRKLHHPGLVGVAQQIYALQQGQPEAGLDFASAALTFGQTGDALRILGQIRSLQGSNARYFHLLSVARFLSGDLPAADVAAKEALKLEPENKVYLANQATIELSSPSVEVQRAAQDRLEKLAQEPNAALTALQSLLRFAASSETAPPHLDSWLEAFEHYTQPRDYLFTLRLAALRRHRPEIFQHDLPLFLHGASQDVESAIAATEWMARQSLFRELLAFRDSLPVEWQDKMEMLGPAIQARLDLGQAAQAGALLEKPAWKSFPTDQLAWRERLDRAQRPVGASSTEADASNWRRILSEAGDSSPALTRLLNLTLQWGWRDEYGATLWSIVERDPADAADAIQDLFALDLRTGDSRDLLRVVKKQTEMHPGDPAYLNNLAFLNLLLEADLAHGEAMAKDLCARYPMNPNFVATLAFACFKTGRIEEGLKLFRVADPAALRGTPPGATYGLLLAAAGDQQAADFLKNADVWMRLPEEQALLNAARAKIAH